MKRPAELRSRAHGAVALVASLLALLSGACGQTDRGSPNAQPAGTTGMGGASGGGGGGASGATGAACCDTGACPCVPPPSSHGVVPMHRLRGAEYANTIADLLQVDAAAPVPDQGAPFEATIDDAQPWFEAAGKVARELFARAQLPGLFDCVGSFGGTPDCVRSVITELGLRAFRRPLLDAELQAFTALYDQLSPTDGARGALEQVLRAVLLSPQFLFHVELSDTPDAAQPERLDSYALAARLSFALWSTTPDAALLQAASGDLTGDAALSAAYDRLAQDGRTLALPDGLSEVWLGAAGLREHQVDRDVLPRFSEELRDGMMDEQRELLRQFWLEPVPLRELLTLDVNYVSAPLAELYGFPPGTQGFANVTDDSRQGLLGQAAFLTLTSFKRRVSATRRGSFVLQRLLCGQLPAPAPGEAGSLGTAPGLSERRTLEQQVAASACQGCHASLDALGLALGSFDAIGAYRTSDSQGQPIDAKVTLPEELVPGAPSVDGLTELSAALAGSRRFQACIAQQLASYLIHRNVSEQTDADIVWPLADRVAEQGSLTELTRQIVMSDHFRFRRLAPTP